MPSSPSPAAFLALAAFAAAAASLALRLRVFSSRRRSNEDDGLDDDPRIDEGGYESLVGRTPLLFLPRISSLLRNGSRIYVKMECANPGGTGKDRPALGMLRSAERRGDLPPPLTEAEGEGKSRTRGEDRAGDGTNVEDGGGDGGGRRRADRPRGGDDGFSDVPPEVHDAVLAALRATRTHGVVIEGTSGSTGISLASLCCSRGHGVVVVVPDDQSKQKADLLRRLGCGVVEVKVCGISNPNHYVNVAKRIHGWLQDDRWYDSCYWEHILNEEKRKGQNPSSASPKERPPRLIKAAFMDQFENLANVRSHYETTGPEIHDQMGGKVDAFVMSAGTGGTLVGAGGCLKERWWRRHFASSSTSSLSSSSPPRIVLVDPPGSSLYHKIKHGVAYAPQQSERTLRRHRYDTLAEGIGLDRITANFALGCEVIDWGGSERAVGVRLEMAMGEEGEGGARDRPARDPRLTDDDYRSDMISPVIDDAVAVTDQQAVDMAHYLLRTEGLLVGSSTAMNLVGALRTAYELPPGSNVVTVVCDGGQRHAARFWNRDFVTRERGLVWPGDREDRGGSNAEVLERLGIATP
ncbi:hypothetical protein ACHAWF_004035 [Thalassiosira exigua]